MQQDQTIEQNQQQKIQTDNNQGNQGSNNQDITDYGDPNYWEERYKKSKGQRYQWLQGIETLKQMLEQQLQHNKSKSILNIGCGNAQIQDHLYELGYTNIYNNDISKVVIQEMEAKRKQKNYDKMVYEVMDVCNMTYKDKTFDMVIDKSTIDALLCSQKPVTSVAMMLKQVYRVLKDDGIYFVVSYGSPFTRKQHLQRPHTAFSIKTKQIAKQCPQNGGKILHYAYICKKQKLSEEFENNYQQKFNQLFKQLIKKEIEEYS